MSKLFLVATNKRTRCRTGDCIISMKQTKVFIIDHFDVYMFTYFTHTYVFTLYTICLNCEKTIQLIDHELQEISVISFNCLKQQINQRE